MLNNNKEKGLHEKTIDNPGGSIGQDMSLIPLFNDLDQLIEYIKLNHGYEYSNNLSLTQFLEGKEVLEMGCGNGYLSFCLYKYVKKLDGYDVDKSAIVQAKINSRKFGLQDKLNFYEYSNYNTQLMDEGYDIVLSSDVIEHVEDPLKYLSVCKRVLKENGYLILTTPNGLITHKNPKLIKMNSSWHITEYYPTELADLLNLSGFFIEKSFSNLNITHTHIFYKINNFLKQAFCVNLPPKICFYAKKVFRGLHSKSFVTEDKFDNYRIQNMDISDMTRKNTETIIILAKKK
jgi:2-polyprenyl-3-methyl-5-hydroxy-6-metoxy-1,4-benzoquinol methylase